MFLLFHFIMTWHCLGCVFRKFYVEQDQKNFFLDAYAQLITFCLVHVDNGSDGQYTSIYLLS